MSTRYTDEQVRDIARDTILAQLIGQISPAGSLSRYGAQIDRLNDFRATYNAELLPLPTEETEERILRATVQVVEEFWDIYSQIQLSLTHAPPTLGVLMERDVILAALGVGSEYLMSVAVDFGKAYGEANKSKPDAEDDSNPLAKIFSAMGKSSVPDQAVRTVKAIMGEVKCFDESGATVARMPIINNPWYIAVAGSLLDSLGSEVTVPTVLPERVKGWTP